MVTRGNGERERGRTATVMGTVYVLSLVLHSRVVQGIVPDSLPVRIFDRCPVDRCPLVQVCPSSFDMT